MCFIFSLLFWYFRFYAYFLFPLNFFFFLNIYKKIISKNDKYCWPSPNELAAFKLVARIWQDSNLKGIGIFMSNITVITLNKFGKRARGCCVHVFLVITFLLSHKSPGMKHCISKSGGIYTPHCIYANDMIAIEAFNV